MAPMIKNETRLTRNFVSPFLCEELRLLGVEAPGDFEWCGVRGNYALRSYKWDEADVHRQADILLADIFPNRRIDSLMPAYTAMDMLQVLPPTLTTTAPDGSIEVSIDCAYNHLTVKEKRFADALAASLIQLLNRREIAADWVNRKMMDYVTNKA